MTPRPKSTDRAIIPTRKLAARRPPDRPGTKKDPKPDLAVRDNQWKLLCNVDGSHTQLYNLETDIGETKNIADKHPEIVAKLMAIMKREHVESDMFPLFPKKK